MFDAAVRFLKSRLSASLHIHHSFVELGQNHYHETKHSSCHLQVHERVCEVFEIAVSRQTLQIAPQLASLFAPVFDPYQALGRLKQALQCSFSGLHC